MSESAEAVQEDRTQSAEVGGSSYDVLKRRLQAKAEELRSQVDALNAERKDLFGAVETRLVANDHVITEKACVPRDMTVLGDQLLFAFRPPKGAVINHVPEEVLAVYEQREDGTFHPVAHPMLADERFRSDYQKLFEYYKDAEVSAFLRTETALMLSFQVGKRPEDIKVFKWHLGNDGQPSYVDSRSEKEFLFPPRFDFKFRTATRDQILDGRPPLYQLEDLVLVGLVDGKLTFRLVGQVQADAALLTEDVAEPDQSLDDLDLEYALLDRLMVLRVKPYREEQLRTFIVNVALATARRVDGLGSTAVQLPNQDGLVFPTGFYLSTDELKTFPFEEHDREFVRSIKSPNGEDILFAFHAQDDGDYILVPYNVIQRAVETPMVCHGFAIRENGTLVLFRADAEPRRNHAVQVWQTTYVADERLLAKATAEGFLAKLGNRDLVAGIADLRALMALIAQEQTTLRMWEDIVQSATALADRHFWLDQDEAFGIGGLVREIRAAANAAIDEFDRVTSMKADAVSKLEAAEKETRILVADADVRVYERIDEFVEVLTTLRTRLGSVISLRDMRYIDVDRAEAIEKLLRDQLDKIAYRCIDFLLTDDAIKPYLTELDEVETQLPDMKHPGDAEKAASRVAEISENLDTLVELTNTLKIDDAEKTTTIIESISQVKARINQVSAAANQVVTRLKRVHAKAEFAAQFKLLTQTASGYLDQVKTPEECDDLLSRLTVQLEELEGRFADFEDYIAQLLDKRAEITAAFNGKRVQLQEKRTKRAQTLSQSAGRILNSIDARLKTFDSVEAANAYLAADGMVEKLRDLAQDLRDMGSAPAADDIESKLKSLQQESARRIRDAKDLSASGEGVIKFGEHAFTVNKRKLELTTVFRDDALQFHLTGTDWFEEIDDPVIRSAGDIRERELPSESPTVYRSEYLAWALISDVDAGRGPVTPAQLDEQISKPEALTETVRQLAAGRYTEGYEKGIHDADATAIVSALYPLMRHAGRLSHHPSARALGLLSVLHLDPSERWQPIQTALAAWGTVSELTQAATPPKAYVDEIKSLIQAFSDETAFPVPDPSLVDQAADYLVDEFRRGLDDTSFPISRPADDIRHGFEAFLKRRKLVTSFKQYLTEAGKQLRLRYRVVRDWLSAFVQSHEDVDAFYLDEAVAMLLRQPPHEGKVKAADLKASVPNLRGSHPRIQDGTLTLDAGEFRARLSHFERTDLPAFETYQAQKQTLAKAQAEALRLDQFEPKVMSGFVRNKLINDVYLPLVGANLAKQIGAAGDAKRTDLMGLLLLISPPGYGKTTLMEYLANRLGLIFVKINGPALGHGVISLDPNEAPNATAADEVRKLNFGLAMGNNVMLYVDDIQHCHAEFLQKFISLCDAQRKIEGVRDGKAITYDFRGKRVAVVMAGNPYTESGDRFQVPDMLANRADVYNLGDVIGDSLSVFELSYIENALTSHPVLNAAASRNLDDVRRMITAARTGTRENLELESDFSDQEVDEVMVVLDHMRIIQDTVLKVNRMYIASASQADAYRTEPPFLLQGSYRNMNKIVEKISPVMTDAEVIGVVDDHYKEESQILTANAEFNLLRYRELVDRLSTEDSERLAFIRQSFQRSVKLGTGGDAMDRIAAGIGVIVDIYERRETGAKPS